MEGFTEYGAAEVESIRDILTRIYPTGVASYVGDSEDYFWLLEHGLSQVKEEILARKPDSNGLCKFVIRPDSSPKTPLEVILGDYYLVKADRLTVKESIAAKDAGHEWLRHKGIYYSILDNGETLKVAPISEVPAEVKGSLQLLWNTFGGTINKEGFKVLNDKIGLIYGEAITPAMQEVIYSRMVDEGWCVSNILMGVGSWGFLKDSSRDTFGIAVKGTHSKLGDRSLSMQKTPKTAMGSKKSAKGLLRVEREDGKFVLYQEQTPEQEAKGLLKEVFVDGECAYNTTLKSIADTLKSTE